MRLNAKQLRSYSPLAVSHLRKANSEKLKAKNNIYIILDNVLDTYNIGSIFRLADAVAAKKIYLCGGTETPPNHRIKKASINTTEWVDWEYCESAVDAIRKLKIENGKWKMEKQNNCQLSIVNCPLQIVAIEQSKNSVLYDKFDYQLPIVLIVGNETTGVSKEVLKMTDAIVELPMYGVNISLNVMVCLGIVLYEVLEKVHHSSF